jgi:hypothetical protein
MKFQSVTLALLAAGAATLSAQDVKVNVLTEFWATEMMDNSLRLNGAEKATASAYYDGMSTARFNENTFAVKRAEVYLNYKISDEWSAMVMFDPNNSTATVSNNVMQDFVITWNPGYGFQLRAGQFKMPTTYEATIVAAKDIYFFDRNQLNRVFGDKRDRGIAASYAYGRPDAFQGKVNFAISNGTTDDGSTGKNNDSNAQKDYTFRFEGGWGAAHRFGFYYRTGETNLKDSTMVTGMTNTGTATAPVLTLPAAWTAAGVTAQQIKDNKDKTTLEGVYYAFDNDTWHADFEYATGLLGRRFPTLFASTGTWALNATTGVSSFTATPMGREYLDQKFEGYALTGVYKMGHHQITARYDMLNYNSGDNWYTAANPYKPTTGATAGSDFSPKYTETTVGYNYVFIPTKYSLGKLKVDYIMRSKNFLTPLAGQTGAKGGDSLVASVMLAF